MSNQNVLILDCVSDHEVEKNLATEGDVLRSILANRNRDKGPRHYRYATAKTFKGWRPTIHSDLRYVHICAHANKKQLAFIEDFIPWKDVAKKLTTVFPKLDRKQDRALCLSCCFSEYATDILAPLLADHFTCVFYLAKEEIDFDESITLWSMFYLKKPLDEPQSGKSIRESINNFLDEHSSTLLFRKVPRMEHRSKNHQSGE